MFINIIDDLNILYLKKVHVPEFLKNTIQQLHVLALKPMLNSLVSIYHTQQDRKQCCGGLRNSRKLHTPATLAS